MDTNTYRYKLDQLEVYSTMIHTGYHRIPLLRNASTKALKPMKQNGINGLWPRLDVQLYSLGCVDSL